jgi:hypothetical protein
MARKFGTRSFGQVDRMTAEHLGACNERATMVPISTEKEPP